jgi:hypothetical protein
MYYVNRISVDGGSGLSPYKVGKMRIIREV